MEQKAKDFLRVLTLSAATILRIRLGPMWGGWEARDLICLLRNFGALANFEKAEYFLKFDVVPECALDKSVNL